MSIAQEVGFVSFRHDCYTKDGVNVVPMNGFLKSLDNDVVWFADVDNKTLWKTGLSSKLNIKSSEYFLFTRHSKIDSDSKVLQAYSDVVNILNKFESVFPGFSWRIASRLTVAIMNTGHYRRFHKKMADSIKVDSDLFSRLVAYRYDFQPRYDSSCSDVEFLQIVPKNLSSLLERVTIPQGVAFKYDIESMKHIAIDNLISSGKKGFIKYAVIRPRLDLPFDKSMLEKMLSSYWQIKPLFREWQSLSEYELTNYLFETEISEVQIFNDPSEALKPQVWVDVVDSSEDEYIKGLCEISSIYAIQERNEIADVGNEHIRAVADLNVELRKHIMAMANELAAYKYHIVRITPVSIVIEMSNLDYQKQYKHITELAEINQFSIWN